MGSVYRKNRKNLYSVAAAGLCLLYLAALAHHYVIGAVMSGAFFRMSVPILLGCYYTACGLRDGKELQLLSFYWLWLAFTRMMNGDLFLSSQMSYLIEMALMLLAFTPGLLLEKKQRENLLDGFCTALAVFYSLLAVPGLIAGIRHVELISPLDGYATHLIAINWRLSIQSMNPNETAGHFLLSFCALLILFFRKKNTIVRSLLVIAGLMDLCVIALTYSRNAELQIGLVLAITFCVLLSEKIRKLKKAKQAVLILLMILLIVPLSYKSFDMIRTVLWKPFAEERAEMENTPLSDEIIAQEHLEEGSTAWSDRGGTADGGRLGLWRGGLKSLMMEPRRLLFGCETDSLMAYYNSGDVKETPHLHNSVLQVLNHTGLIGLGLAAAFCVLVLSRGWILSRLPDTHCSAGEKLLVLPVISQLCFYQLESGLFSFADFRVFAFFFFSGILVGTEREKVQERTLSSGRIPA